MINLTKCVTVHLNKLVNSQIRTAITNLEQEFTKATDFLSAWNLQRVDWVYLLDEVNDVEAVDIFYAELHDFITKHVPLCRYVPSDYPIWYSHNLIKCLKEKEKFHNHFKQHGNPVTMTHSLYFVPGYQKSYMHASIVLLPPLKI